MDNDYTVKLERHIEALDKAYNNLIDILLEDVAKDDDDNVKLKDTQRKNFAEGIQKASETANNLLAMIKEKQTELDVLKGKPKEPEIPEKEEKEGNNDSKLTKYLN